ncbi:MAG TPA: translocation/assembly module TamB domain-containing protein, partial [Vicinamibacterales bacterium]|nr:translocation/assembly module TamB domain-containing protein [Vicinamibacterales bacterium]
YGPFSEHTPIEPVPVGGDLAYTISADEVQIGPSRVATPTTYVEFEGTTAYGERSRIPFHVTSADWQDSDRVFAGILTAFGSHTSAIDIGGYGTFDGVMLNSFAKPRIEGAFASEDMRAFDVTWGATRGDVAIENSYADVKNGVVTSGGSTILVDGKFSLGFPRADQGEELDARVRITKRPVADLRHAFDLDEYRLDGLLSGEFHVYGTYQRPLGFGTVEVADGQAYGEAFRTASASVRLEGEGVRLDNLEVAKGTGRGTGAAFVGWDGTYSFNFNGQNIPVESVTAVKGFPLPLSGIIDLTATGSGAFAKPTYDVHGTIRDLFVGDEGIGQVVADLNLNGDVLTTKLEAASPRLAISGTGRIALTPQMDTEMSFSVTNTSLDPYVRLFQPALSPYATAIASGTVKVTGELADIDHLLVDTTVDQLDVRLFDYALKNASPIRIALDRDTVRVSQMQLVGEATQLDVSGLLNLHDQSIAMRATGDANLAVLQAFMSNVKSSGRAMLSASLQGSMRDPVVTGSLTVDNGRIRHFALPHALENINGTVRFDSRGVTLDGLTARLGGGPVQFFGRIDKNGYAPGRLDVTMTGQGMRLRFPEGMRSLVDATLMLEGSAADATLSGEVYVRDAVYTKEFNTSGGLLDVFGGGGGAVALPADTATSFEPTLPLRYDVHVYAPSTLQVRNSTAQLAATADLQLRGTFDKPLLFGRTTIDRGNFTLEGKRYTFTRGAIDFNNPTKIEPFFDVELETRVRVPGETYIATIRGNGTAGNLHLDFSSDPPLPPVEVLSLLFSDIGPGRDVELRQYRSDVTPEQELLREQAARALTGAVSSQVGKAVEQTFGVDTFQITPTLIDPNQQSSRLDPAARLTIGKRLSDRAYLTYARSLSSSSADQIIVLEYDQTDRFSWILSRNEDRTYALEVRVRHTF